MANLFLGFPVARAKIADMIAEAAPPAEHHTQHEDGGADEIDCTGLAGAGVAFPLRGIWFDDHFTDHARWVKTYVGTGELVRFYSKMTLKTGTTNPSSAEIRLSLTYPMPSLTWDKKRHILFHGKIQAPDSQTAKFKVLSGWETGANMIGFEITGGKLYGINANSAAQTNTEIETYSAGLLIDDFRLEAIHHPGEKVEFWVDGVLEQTSTTNLPAGTGAAVNIAQIEVDNNATANNVFVEFDHIQMYQAS